MRRTLAALTLLLTAAAAPAAPEVKSDLGTPKSLQIDTGRAKDGVFRLAGRDAAQQLVVTGLYGDGALRDLTATVKYATAPEGIVAVENVTS